MRIIKGFLCGLIIIMILCVTIACDNTADTASPTIAPTATLAPTVAPTEAPLRQSTGLEFRKDGNYVSISGIGTCKDEVLVIPRTRDGKKVISIDFCAFADNAQIKKVVIEGDVEIIDSSAFSGCSNLEEVVIGDSVEEIGIGAFENCISLKKVTLGKNIIKLNSSAFAGCSSLENITLNDSLVTLGPSCFEGCKIKTIHIPASVTSVAIDALPLDTLETITVDFENKKYSVKDNCLIKEDTLVLAVNATKIPTGIKHIGVNAFKENDNITDLVIPNGVESIDKYAFKECIYLKSVTLPESLKTIGEGAFEDCIQLKTVDLSKGVTRIEKQAFCNTAISSIMISEPISIKFSAFDKCNRFAHIIYKGDKDVEELYNSLNDICNKPITVYLYAETEAEIIEIEARKGIKWGYWRYVNDVPTIYEK